MSNTPPIKIGPDGLPHCGWCTSETLCGPHRKAVNLTLDTMKTPAIMGTAQADLRYIIKRPSLSMREEMHHDN